MKLRLVHKEKQLLLYCEDGSIINVDDNVLRTLFINYRNPSSFTQEGEKWNITYTSMDIATGNTLAYVNDNSELCILDANPFYKLISTVGNDEYITLKEYCEMYGRGESRIKKLCDEQKITGAIKKGGCWFIPINAPYPEDGRRKKS